MVTIGFIDKGKTIPKINFSKEVLDILSRSWSRVLVVKLLGKSIGYQMLCRRLQLLSKPKDELGILDLSHKFFLVRFDLEKDLEIVLMEFLGSSRTITLLLENGTLILYLL